MQLLRTTAVSSQQQLTTLLRTSGFEATQSTVSRDLEDLGAVKVRRGGKTVYSLPAEASPPGAEGLRRIISESATELKSGGGVILLRTPPGHASMVASALDHSHVEGLAGTIAGDDTVLAVCDIGANVRTVERKLRAMIDRMPEGT